MRTRRVTPARESPHPNAVCDSGDLLLRAGRRPFPGAEMTTSRPPQTSGSKECEACDSQSGERGARPQGADGAMVWLLSLAVFLARQRTRARRQRERAPRNRRARRQAQARPPKRSARARRARSNRSRWHSCASRDPRRRRAARRAGRTGRAARLCRGRARAPVEPLAPETPDEVVPPAEVPLEVAPRQRSSGPSRRRTTPLPTCSGPRAW